MTVGTPFEFIFTIAYHALIFSFILYFFGFYGGYLRKWVTDMLKF